VYNVRILERRHDPKFSLVTSTDSMTGVRFPVALGDVRFPFATSPYRPWDPSRFTCGGYHGLLPRRCSAWRVQTTSTSIPCRG